MDEKFNEFTGGHCLGEQTIGDDRRAVKMNRRRLLKAVGLGGGGFMIACGLGPVMTVGADESSAPESFGGVFNAFVSIKADNTVTVVIKHLDKGQGVTTGLTTIVAEELDADWSQMRWQFAPADATRYNNLAWGSVQGTGGSSSIRNSWQQLREAGAMARAMLVQAAAAKWGVSADHIRVQKGKIYGPENKSFTFGEIANAAAQIEIEGPVRLKTADEFQLIGHHVPRIDSAEKSTGQAIYTSDITLPEMLNAAVLRAPRFGAKLTSIDDSAARKIEGVIKIVRVPSGVAVIATSYWSALKAKKALKATWDSNTGERRSSADISSALKELLDQPGAIAASRGDVSTTFTGAAKLIETDFEFPYLAHASMEPLNAIVKINSGVCEIWTACQSQTRDQATAAAILGIEPSQVTIHTQLAGGSFGRRAVPHSDYVAEAVEVARAFGKPVPIKVQWTREDDMAGGFYRPVSRHRMKAALDSKGKLIAWSHRVVGQSFLKGTPFESMIREGVDVTLVEGARKLPYQIEHFHCDTHLVDVGVPTLWWRSVGHTHNGFATEVFFDEVALAASRDPITLRQELLSKSPRHLGALNLALKHAGSAPTGKNQGRGIAVHESFRSFVAQVADVTVNESGQVSVDQVTAAVDCGLAINPDIIRAQIEGGIGYGLSAFLREAITLKEGVVEQQNFDRYQVLRISEMPNVNVHIVPSAEAPTGVGEPGLPPIAPAVANAIRNATGKKITRLPLMA